MQASTLKTALAKLQGQQLKTAQVKRVVVDRPGTIYIEVHEQDKQRFFAYTANELKELQPEDDPKIPLAAKLRGDDFAAEYTLISYRPGRRIVLGPAQGGRGTIIKGYKKHQAEKAAENYACAVSACEQGGFDVPELLQYQIDSDSLVISKRIGKPPDLAPGAVNAWRLIGSSLRHFQQSDTAQGLKTFNNRDELAVLDERARRFLLVMPSLPLAWRRGRERLEEVARDLPPGIKGLAHRDLHDGQFIITDQTISLLDFDLLCIADVALDAGNLLAHMKLRMLQGRQGNEAATVSTCSKAFLLNLDRQDEPGFGQQLLFYQASSFYRLALLYALRPGWAHLTDVLTREGTRCVAILIEKQGGS